jgi:hypothetical protein
MTLGVMASAPAKADFSIVRWADTRLCAVWDNSVGNQPWPEGYVVAATGIPTWEIAWAAYWKMVEAKECGW